MSTDEKKIPFEEYIPMMSVDVLRQLIDNWLWEGPLELTPNEAQTRKLIAFIEARQDRKACGPILDACREYLEVFVKQKKIPVTPARAKPAKPSPGTPLKAG